MLDPHAEVRLRAYLDEIGGMLGDKRRRRAFAKYACGILSDGERKSVEPIATRACGSVKEAEAEHRRVLRFLAESEWEDRPVRGYASRYALAAMQERGRVRCSILDDTGFLKQGRCSPCVQRQYTGSAGKTTNCQVGVSLSVATEHAHLPIDMQLYMPESWANDPGRRRRAKIPESVVYRPKWVMGLDMIEKAVADGIPLGVVLADADYGNKAEFRDRLDELNLEYAVAVQKTTCVRRVRGAGNARRLGERKSVEDLAFELRPSDIRSVTWREGTKTHLRARFAIVRVEPMPADGKPRTEQWLIIEWPEDSHLPEKYALATVPPGWSRKRIVRMLKERWRTERAYEDLKGELGLDHFEGRSYGGWNHHVTVVMLCYAFLVAEQARAFPPSQARPEEAPPDGSLRRAA
ncbi:MAG: IS701 family transposase [Candidatus Hydrogenedentes bacterium]|nr:IS701 family transposase [Candidatus Hydrogenedentota bacterium]